jgi:hypothetical protein
VSQLVVGGYYDLGVSAGNALLRGAALVGVSLLAEVDCGSRMPRGREGSGCPPKRHSHGWLLTATLQLATSRDHLVRVKHQRQGLTVSSFGDLAWELRRLSCKCRIPRPLTSSRSCFDARYRYVAEISTRLGQPARLSARRGVELPQVPENQDDR